MLRLALALMFLSLTGAGAQTLPPHAMAHRHASGGGAPALPNQAGQSAFAAIQEVVQRLAADPKTDWSKVDIEALRQHLIDMDNVTLRAEATSEPVDGGMRFVARGPGPVAASIQRMTAAHAAAMNGVDGWRYSASPTSEGAEFTVLVPTRDQAKLRGLGFLGVLALGMHHQAHHLMIARGETIP